MSLDVSPEVEQTVRGYAAREGVSVNDLLARVFPPSAAAPVGWRVPVGRSDDEKRAAVLALLGLPRAEIARRNAPSIARLDAELAVAADATPEERAAADAELRALKDALNASRAVTGERPVWAEKSVADGS